MTTLERIPPGVATTHPGPRPDPDSRPRRPPALLSPKVFPRHLDRLAAVYVRQSSARQVLENRESTALQYRLRDRAIALGWAEAQVLVIDEDLGQSGQSVAGRPGFQRLLAEVGLDHVGLVLGIEMSRLARSCQDWHQLLDDDGHAADDPAIPFGDPKTLSRIPGSHEFGQRTRDIRLEGRVEAAFSGVDDAVQVDDVPEVTRL